MANSKLALAVGLVAATLALVLTNVLGGPALLQSGGLAAVIAISAIALSAGAFVVSRRQRSLEVAGLLAALGLDFEVFSAESLWALLFLHKDIRHTNNISDTSTISIL
jgi:hypothetical protein